MHMTLGVGDNRQPLSFQSNRRSTSGVEKYPPIIRPTSDKGQLLVVFSYNKIPTVLNMEGEKEVIRLKK